MFACLFEWSAHNFIFEQACAQASASGRNSCLAAMPGKRKAKIVKVAEPEDGQARAREAAEADGIGDAVARLPENLNMGHDQDVSAALETVLSHAVFRT